MRLADSVRFVRITQMCLILAWADMHLTCIVRKAIPPSSSMLAMGVRQRVHKMGGRV
jgi:hypothetical protein